MGRERWKLILLAVSLAVLVSLAGCGDGGGSPTTPTPTPSEKLPAEQEINAAASLVNQSSDQYNSIEENIAHASSRGVNTNKSSTHLQTANSYNQQAEENLQSARQEYRDGDFHSALSEAKDARENANASIENLEKARDALQREYEVAVSGAEHRLQRANQQYQKAQAFVQSANEAGADVSGLKGDLQSTRTELEDGISAVTSSPPNPRKANQSATIVNQESESIQTSAVEIAREATARQAIRDEGSRLSSSFAQQFVQRARDGLEGGEYSRIEDDLVTAQYAEQLALNEEYVTEVEEKNNVSLSALSESIQTAKSALQDGDDPERPVDSVQNEVERSRDCIVKIESARAQIATARQASTPFVSVNTTQADGELEDALDNLDTGHYNESCEAAERANDLAEAAEQQAVEERESSFFKGAIGKVVDAVNSVKESFGLSHASELRTPNTVSSTSQITVQSVSVSYQPPTEFDVTKLDFESGSTGLPPVSVDVEGSEPDSESPSGVEFEIDAIDVGSPDSSIFTTCVPASATLRNTGGETATQVSAEMRVFDAQGNPVEFESGGTRLTETLGMIQPGGSKSVSKEICIGNTRAIGLQGTEITIVIDIHSDQKSTVTKEFTDSVESSF